MNDWIPISVPVPSELHSSSKKIVRLWLARKSVNEPVVGWFYPPDMFIQEGRTGSDDLDVAHYMVYEVPTMPNEGSGSVDSLRLEEHKYFKRYRNNLAEWAEDDDMMRASCKLVFPEKFVEGDSYGVPPTTYLFDCLVSRILQLEGRPRPDGWDDGNSYNDVKRLQLTKGVGKQLEEIGQRIISQDNRHTSQPIYIIFQVERIYGLDPNYADKPIWMHQDGEEANEGETKTCEEHYEKTGDELDGWYRTDYVDRDRFVTACFTEEGAKTYLEKNGHNLKKPHIYVDTLWRNDEMIAVREFIMGLAQKEFDARTATPEEVDAYLRSEGIDPDEEREHGLKVIEKLKQEIKDRKQ